MNVALFVVVAAVLLAASISVVAGRELVRSVLWLAVALASTAVLFVLLHAEFIAAVQILLYTGGIITLMLFGVMLTARITGVRIAVGSAGRVRGGLVAVGVFATLAWGILASQGTIVAHEPLDPESTTRLLGAAFLTDYLLPMEVLSLLLLAVMVGAIVLARRRDPS
ncbi:MAG: NADH-quinone oxidoreductase subunit J [Deltaproteobacteria bacterium]|nr:NADH-quinone oxidoreductase subunit J [Deltaproteobacteria bacterium]